MRSPDGTAAAGVGGAAGAKGGECPGAGGGAGGVTVVDGPEGVVVAVGLAVEAWEVQWEASSLVPEAPTAAGAVARRSSWVAPTPGQREPKRLRSVPVATACGSVMLQLSK